jgi:hypothetical protein
MKAGNRQGVRVSYFEGLATHIDPESCVGGRKAAGEALIGESTGSVPSHEMHTNLEADHVPVMGRQHQDKRYASLSWLQRGQRHTSNLVINSSMRSTKYKGMDSKR